MEAKAEHRVDVAPAGFFSRLVAFVTDLVVLSVAVAMSTWVVQSVERLLRPAARIELEPALLAVVPLLVVAYYVGLWTAFGQTVGKRLLGLRVIAVDGGPVKPGRALLRFAGYFLSALPAYVGFVWVLVDPGRRGWHDLLARTLVVYDRPGETHGRSLEATSARASRALQPTRAVGGSARSIGVDGVPEAS